MNKKVLYLILSLTLLTVSSCVENIFKHNERSNAIDKDVENLISTIPYNVEVRKGYTTNVSYKGQLIASTSKPMTILIPKSAENTRANNKDLQVFFQVGETTSSKSLLWQTVLFEDSKKGDFDYNDLVFRAKYTTSDNQTQVSIHPIALGSTKPIKLGLHWVQGTQEGKIIVADNCRNDLFGNRMGFINTYRYDVHFDSFVKTINIPTSGVTDPVKIWWFIQVDNNYSTTIYAVNDVGEQCIDDNGKPYGFAITDARAAAPQPMKRSNLTRSKATDNNDWNTDIVPSTPEWAQMPELPTIPSGAKSMDEYKNWETKNKIYHLEAGKSFAGQLNFIPNFQLFVEGELTLSSSYGDGISTIIVMPGGKLTIPSRAANVKIVNFGSVTMGDKVTFNNATLQTLTLEAPRTSIIAENNSQLFVQGAAHLNSLTINKNTTHTGSLTISNELYLTNHGSVIVNDELTTQKLKLDTNASLYVGCQLHVSSDINATNHTTISVKGNLSTNKIETSSNTTINIMSGAVLSCETYLCSNISSCHINVIGNDYAAVQINTMNVSGGLNMEKSFQGFMYLNFNSLQESGIEIDLDLNRLKLPDYPVLINSGEASLDATSCSPGLNGGTSNNGAETMGWFPYPKEGVNISSCYDFNSWVQGIYDFTLKPQANVFDIYDTNPIEGENKSIYEIK